jgi:hypothetical protein
MMISWQRDCNALTQSAEVDMTPSILHKNGRHAASDTTSESISEIAASMASRLTRSRNGEVAFDETQQGSIRVFRDVSCDRDSLGENTTLNEVLAPQMPRDQPQHTKLTTDEYRARADVCLNWAREAPSDEARLACIILAQTWLKAAMHDGSDGPGGLPLAPTL